MNNYYFWKVRNCYFVYLVSIQCACGLLSYIYKIRTVENTAVHLICFIFINLSNRLKIIVLAFTIIAAVLYAMITYMTVTNVRLSKDFVRIIVFQLYVLIVIWWFHIFIYWQIFRNNFCKKKGGSGDFAILKKNVERS